MHKEKALNVSRTDGFNEFYTTYEQCEEVLGYLKSLGLLNKKSICCPCDGEHSNIVKWLKANTKAKIVYFDYLDCNSAKARQQMLKCGCVITNPPFDNNEWMPLFNFCKQYKLAYFLWGSPHNFNYNLDYICVVPSHKLECWDYDLPKGVVKPASTLFYTNFEVPYIDYDYSPAKSDQYYKGIPVYDYIKNVPKNYYDWMYVPITFTRYIKHYEIDVNRTKDSPTGKYIRICIRRKNKHG